ncbi:hypothetical protein ACRALDRAFT_1094098 [Sodiomyces alcalophilus JCM 7366]|uniref:uncharacterized protein n=1 Tax=Sodiomyces alcalophilus JCM 7366 TaxID=591952 RepID=UPI0039B61554
MICPNTTGKATCSSVRTHMRPRPGGTLPICGGFNPVPKYSMWHSWFVTIFRRAASSSPVMLAASKNCPHSPTLHWPGGLLTPTLFPTTRQSQNLHQNTKSLHSIKYLGRIPNMEDAGYRYSLERSGDVKLASHVPPVGLYVVLRTLYGPKCVGLNTVFVIPALRTANLPPPFKRKAQIEALSTMSEAYERERQNNARLEELSSKVSALRGVTIDIYDNARSQDVIDNTSETFSSMATSLTGSAGRLGRMATAGNKVAILKLAGLIIGPLILLYYLVNFHDTSFTESRPSSVEWDVSLVRGRGYGSTAEFDQLQTNSRRWRGTEFGFYITCTTDLASRKFRVFSWAVWAGQCPCTQH